MCSDAVYSFPILKVIQRVTKLWKVHILPHLLSVLCHADSTQPACYCSYVETVFGNTAQTNTQQGNGCSRYL